MKTRQMKKGRLPNPSNQEGDRIGIQERTRGEERREYRRGEERIPISLFHVGSVLLVDLASVSDIRFSADSEVG
jgi:hypothetical protein